MPNTQAPLTFRSSLKLHLPLPLLRQGAGVAIRSLSPFFYFFYYGSHSLTFLAQQILA